MQPKDNQIDELADKGMKKYLFKRFLYFLKNHGITINMFLLVCILVIVIWYGRPIYDKFNRLPQKIEITEKVNQKQDSLLKVFQQRERYRNNQINQQFDRIFNSLNDLVDFKSESKESKEMLKRLIESNRIKMLSILRENSYEEVINEPIILKSAAKPDSIILDTIKKDTLLDTIK